jgi:hypothetical protein
MILTTGAQTVALRREPVLAYTVGATATFRDLDAAADAQIECTVHSLDGDLRSGSCPEAMAG